MKQLIGGIVIAIFVIFGLAWLIQGSDFFMYKVFAPKYEQTRRETFEQSKAYKQGMVQELQNMQFDYIKTTDPNAKAALASVILHRAADFDPNNLPADLRSFIEKLKAERTAGKY